MDDNTTIGFIVLMFFLTTVATLCFRVVDRKRGSSRLGARDAAAMEQISAVAQRMEQRMAALERILDAEAPSWRDNAEITGGRYGR